MKTRRQQQQAAEEKAERNNSKKPSKASLIKKQQEVKKAEKGKSIGAKKIKIQTSVSIKQKSKQVKAKIVRKKDQKNIRVKESPKGKRSQAVSKSNPKVQPAQPKEKVKEKKQTNKQAKSKAKSKEPSPQPLPRKNISVKNPEAKLSKKDEQKQVVKTVTMKGKVPIDDHFPLNKADYHVLENPSKIYSATLNQTNVMNNNNKFYILQILQSDTNINNCYFYTRWGRVGVVGNFTNIGPMPITSAYNNFQKKLKEKTKGGQYRQVQLNYGNQDQDTNKEEQKKPDANQADQSSSVDEDKKESKLPKQVQNLMELIFDISMMKKQMVQIGYNVNKMPLGKLSKQSIKKGYGILKQLYDQIKGQNKNATKMALTNDFYSNIPHNFGFSHMSNHILDTEQKVKQKIEMLEALAQIKVATSILSQKKQDSNKLDSNYSKLNRKIEPVDRFSTEFQHINNYLHTTHGRHHNSYSLELTDLFRLQNQTENVRYTKDIHNKMLLWHGSRLTNFVGILSQGLRIAPPEAPVTGYMFGKGVYFADMSSKSANYCFTSRDNNTGILLLCQVALGNMNEKTHADYYAANLPVDKHSTKGVGKIRPDPKNAVEIQKDITIPMGPGIQTFDPNVYLRYNEFIVYDIAQIKIKYLLRIKFNYA